MTQWTRSGALACALLAALALVACSSNPPAPEPAQSNPAPGAAPPAPIFPPPYRFGEVQQQAPPITDGKIPVVRRIATDKPYVFITIDDGQVKDPDALRLIKESGTRPVLFLNQRYVQGHEDYFKQIVDATGATIGDHTVSHPNLRGKPYAFQHKEICDDADSFQREFGKRPTLFRPPFGTYDANTLQAAAACGMRAAVLWTAAVNDGHVQFQEGDKLRAGDIVLMHFRKTFAQDYTAFVDEAKRAGLTPVPLTDFLG
ncbi:polysaccharide deacetylase family protein [Amycolatopsis anabasis]|uniref:polysaccharide deacetylase family protein n=1 Tax=Amycolatopsis anabasis TaxID=1840409 RepID=UPI00131EAE01|nr:polysaccharide deacetylase family protein [Amycolatopsis anabasis]